MANYGAGAADDDRSLRISDPEPRLQDTVISVGQDVIADRSAERLGRSDAAVILLRKIWKRELRLLVEGKPVTQFTFPSFSASDELAGLDLGKNASAQAVQTTGAALGPAGE